MLAQRVTRSAMRLAGEVADRTRRLGVLHGVEVPTLHITISARPAFEPDGSDADVTWLGEVPRTAVQAARTAGVPRPEFGKLQAAGLPGRTMLVLSLPGASLATDDGAVITARGELVYETIWDDEAFARSEFRTQKRLPPAVDIEGTCASVISLWHANYHHWLFDALPRLAALELAGLASLPLIVPEHMSSFQRDTLALLGYGPERWRAFTHGHVRPTALVWPSPASHIGFPSGYAVDWLRSRILPKVEASAGARRRLYLSRSLAQTRRIRNEDDVVEALSRFGFETVYPERLTFEQQVALFSSAEAVVAPHGAGMSNIVFGERLAVLEFLQPQYLNLCYYALAGSCRHDYWYLLAEPCGRPRKEADLMVPIQPLHETVEQMLSGSESPAGPAASKHLPERA
jgi:capsular polysaccharide biosynthesis protein